MAVETIMTHEQLLADIQDLERVRKYKISQVQHMDRTFQGTALEPYDYQKWLREQELKAKQQDLDALNNEFL